MSASASRLEQIVSRAQKLYSRPTVAMEVVRLAEQPRVDSQALKKCVEQDPALACKILRVVNSSLYGLNRPVADLNQAIGLLGIKPLKLLVLGFSLPDELFAEVAARELRWYWTNTLTRAVAARSLSEQLWHQSGDEAFIAGLLQDIGVLVLMRELGAPYVKFLSGAIDEKCSLAVLEQDTLGFDHMQLSAALLGHWQLPQRLVDAIATPKRQSRLSRMSSPEGDLPQILHLAELLVQVVGQQRFDLLPELLEGGKVYRGMTKQKLTTLVEGLQPQVDQLAEVLSLELLEKRDYVRMLLAAHQAMAALSEDVAGGGHSDQDDTQVHEQLLAQTRELSQAMRDFLESPGSHARTDQETEKRVVGHAAHPRVGTAPAPKAVEITQTTNPPAMLQLLLAAATRCREHRSEFSLLLVELNRFSAQTGARGPLAGRQLRLTLRHACSTLDTEDVSLMPLGEARIAAVLTNCERSVAVDVAHNVIAAIGKSTASMPNSSDDATATVSIGVATVGVVPRNFDPISLIERAERCLSAARACGISTVKSIEV
jgi:HD-like signal output (HDOD) protein/GGDEF domain-containing protein